MCKMGHSLSHFVKLMSGVRQGGVLSPQYFALVINDVTILNNLLN